MHTPTGTEAAVCADIAERQRLGIAKYGTTVADNPLALREWLQHAYEETLDKAVYLKRAIEEMDKPEWIGVGWRVLVRPVETSGWWDGFVSSVHGNEAYVLVGDGTLPFKIRKADYDLLWIVPTAAPVSARSFAEHRHVGLPEPVPACDWIEPGEIIEVLTDSPHGEVWSKATVRARGKSSAMVEGPNVGNDHMIHKGGKAWRRVAPAPVQPPSAEDPPWMHV